MSADDDAALARLLHSHVSDPLTWLDDYPDGQVDPDAVASIRRSVDFVIDQLPPSNANGSPPATPAHRY